MSDTPVTATGADRPLSPGEITSNAVTIAVLTFRRLRSVFPDLEPRPVSPGHYVIETPEFNMTLDFKTQSRAWLKITPKKTRLDPLNMRIDGPGITKDQLGRLSQYIELYRQQIINEGWSST